MLLTMLYVFFVSQVGQFRKHRGTITNIFVGRIQHFLIQFDVCILQAQPFSFNPDQDDDEEGGQTEEEGGQEQEQNTGVFLVQLLRREQLSSVGINKAVTLILKLI